MEEWLAQLCLFLFDLFGDVLIQLLLEVLVNLIPADWRNKDVSALPEFPRTVTLSIFGAVSAIASLIFWPHPIFHSTRFHGISLLVSPLVTGALMKQFGEYRQRNGKPRLVLGTFRSGAAFGFGWAVVRFLGAR